MFFGGFWGGGGIGACGLRGFVLGLFYKGFVSNQTKLILNKTKK